MRDSIFLLCPSVYARVHDPRPHDLWRARRPVGRLPEAVRSTLPLPATYGSAVFDNAEVIL